MATTREDRLAAHWKRLGLIPGAPECVIKAVHRVHIELHHPDRGGDADVAKQINASYDEVRGRGSEANVYVAANFQGEPWVVLGISSASDARVIDRAGRQLAGELGSHPRLAERVQWAIDNFSTAATAPESGRRRAPITPPPPPRRPKAGVAPRADEPRPSRPGAPSGLPEIVDFGTVEWGADATQIINLTWKHAPPFNVHIDVAEPVRATVTPSKVLPGRFAVAFAIDWKSSALRGKPSTSGRVMDLRATVRWTSLDEKTLRIKGQLLYPAHVTASPASLDLGAVTLRDQVTASLVVVSTAPVELAIEPTPWLQRVDGAGRALTEPVRLKTNVPVRLGFRIDWAPILERGKKSIDAGRPIRPTGRITLRWNDESVDVPVAVTVAPTPSKRRA